MKLIHSKGKKQNGMFSDTLELGQRLWFDQ